MYAVIESGGKQLRVAVGETVDVERLEGEVGSKVVFDRVLLIQGGEAAEDAARIGAPTVEGARVQGTVVAQHRGPKILTYTYKPRQNANRRRRGHRQDLTRVKIEAIEG